MAMLDHTGRPYTGMGLDRVSVQRKDPEWVARLARAPHTRVVAAGRDAVLVGDGGRLARAPAPAEQLLADPVLLGVEDDGTALFALDIDDLPGVDLGSGTGEGADGRTVSLRDAGTELPRAEAGLAAYVAAMLNWHRRHGFCANCGAGTEITEGGYARHCPRCGADHFPRTDPVVIMSVEHDGRLLLGGRAGWPGRRVSVLAGFVSPGESAEEAVVREVQEESGIVVREPTYVTSQPWPFPSSLMLGFHAVSDGGEPRATDGELERVGWYDRDAIRRSAAGDESDIALPGEVSIARFLIDTWLEG